MAHGPPKYGIRTPPPPFMQYEPFLLGVRVVFKLLRVGSSGGRPSEGVHTSPGSQDRLVSKRVVFADVRL